MSAPTTLNSFVSEPSAPSLSEGSQQVQMENESLESLLRQLLEKCLKQKVTYSEVTITVQKDDAGNECCSIFAIPANAHTFAFGSVHAAYDNDLAPAIMSKLDSGENVAPFQTGTQVFEVKEQHNKLSQPYTIKLAVPRLD